MNAATQFNTPARTINSLGGGVTAFLLSSSSFPLETFRAFFDDAIALFFTPPYLLLFEFFFIFFIFLWGSPEDRVISGPSCGLEFVAIALFFITFFFAVASFAFLEPVCAAAAFKHVVYFCKRDSCSSGHVPPLSSSSEECASSIYIFNLFSALLNLS